MPRPTAEKRFKIFLEKAKDTHGSKYDYSKTIYIRDRTKIIIICPTHGEFKQTPNNHLANHGCNECGGSRKLFTEEFISRASKKFKNKFDYSKIKYKNARSNIKIICPKHGEFKQVPETHLKSKHGCGQCGSDATGIQRRIPIEKFLKKANKEHNFKYDYSRVPRQYKKAFSRIDIICKEHGIFKQSAIAHMGGAGCQKCGYVSQSVLKVGRIEEFIVKANKIHKKRYAYSQTQYKNSHTKISITCHKHGEFKQTPNSHLSGQGCPKCNNKTQTFIFDIIKEMFPDYDVKYNYKGFDWLRTENDYRMELDIFVPGVRLAIEYDGEYHYKPIYWGSSLSAAKERLCSIQQRDSLKNELVLKHTEDIKYFMRFSYKEIDWYNRLKKSGFIKRKVNSIINEY